MMTTRKLGHLNGSPCIRGSSNWQESLSYTCRSVFLDSMDMYRASPSSIVNEVDSIQEMDRRWLHFDEYVVQDVVSVQHPGAYVVRYMECFRGVSHSYIIKIDEDYRPPMIPPKTSTDDHASEIEHPVVVRLTV